MRCIFCKNDCSDSKSIEHIVPESLGNKEHILPPKIVCDKCNHYFSLKIEKPLLEHPYFRNLRFEQGIQNKKGNYIPEKGLLFISPLPEPIKREICLPKAYISVLQHHNSGVFRQSGRVWGTS